MLINDEWLTEYDIKCILFEIFQAGYEQGFQNKKDIKTAYDEYFKELRRKVYANYTNCKNE